MKMKMKMMMMMMMTTTTLMMMMMCIYEENGSQEGRTCFVDCRVKEKGAPEKSGMQLWL